MRAGGKRPGDCNSNTGSVISFIVEFLKFSNNTVASTSVKRAFES